MQDSCLSRKEITTVEVEAWGNFICFTLSTNVFRYRCFLFSLRGRASCAKIAYNTEKITASFICS